MYFRSTPASAFRTLSQLEDYRQASGSAAAALRFSRSQSHRRKRRLDRIHDAKVHPMVGRKVVEGQQHLTIAPQARRGFGMLGTEGVHKPAERILAKIAQCKEALETLH
jgi:hypothetical protein